MYIRCCTMYIWYFSIWNLLTTAFMMNRSFGSSKKFSRSMGRLPQEKRGRYSYLTQSHSQSLSKGLTLVRARVGRLQPLMEPCPFSVPICAACRQTPVVRVRTAVDNFHDLNTLAMTNPLWLSKPSVLQCTAKQGIKRIWAISVIQNG